jgi:hypothetical protein
MVILLSARVRRTGDSEMEVYHFAEILAGMTRS